MIRWGASPYYLQHPGTVVSNPMSQAPDNRKAAIEASMDYDDPVGEFAGPMTVVGDLRSPPSPTHLQGRAEWRACAYCPAWSSCERGIPSSSATSHDERRDTPLRRFK